jgi:hypothetical protein
VTYWWAQPGRELISFSAHDDRTASNGAIVRWFEQYL